MCLGSHNVEDFSHLTWSLLHNDLDIQQPACTSKHDTLLKCILLKLDSVVNNVAFRRWR